MRKVMTLGKSLWMLFKEMCKSVAVSVSLVWAKWNYIRIKNFVRVKEMLGVDEGAVYPWWLFIIKFFFSPYDTIYMLTHRYQKAGDAKYDAWRDIYTIYGMNYTGALFRSFGEGGIRIGGTLRIIKREDGIVTVREERDGAGNDKG